ncbi:DUF6919 domain-containing protein [Streptomyces jumonjinensis]|uniref:DUF6919 domain-containing protein n=1 Tax=Streptomyces jumonjinensis TaxID=1945 RepID=UPI0037B30A4B
MSRADQRRWRSARTLADLADLTALWLQGRIASQPGYEPGQGPDAETRPLIPALTALNRAGILTTDSQPGHRPEHGWDHAAYAQREAVSILAPRAAADRIAAAARAAGLLTTLGGREQIPVTTRNGTPVTWLGRVHGPTLRATWKPVGPDALTAVTSAVPLAVAGPEYAPCPRLWEILSREAGR